MRASWVRIVSGQGSREKTVRVGGVSAAEVVARVGGACWVMGGARAWAVGSGTIAWTARRASVRRRTGSTSCGATPIAERFHGTRRAHRDETAEDYAEAILNLVEREGVCRVRDLSGMMGVTHVTVTRIVSRLQRLGWWRPSRTARSC